MKKALIEKLEPIETTEMGWHITVQDVDEDVICLNVHKNKVLLSRHCVNLVTGEYATLTGSVWRTTKIEGALGADAYCGCCGYDETAVKRGKMFEADEEYIKDRLGKTTYMKTPVITLISNKEREYQREKREITEMNRYQRVKDKMAKIPDIPKGIYQWIDEREIGGQNFMLKNRKTGLWSCSACGKESSDNQVKNKNRFKPRNNDLVICPKCCKTVKLLSLKKTVDITTHFALVQPVDDAIGVVRHFKAHIYCEPQSQKAISIKEEIRILMLKDPKGYSIKNAFSQRKICEIFYEQTNIPWDIPDGGHHEGYFDNKSNPTNKHEYPGYFYDDGIEEAFKNTAYEKWTRIFTQMSAAGIKASYNRLMVAQDDDNLIRVIELLYRGRFYRLLREESDYISYWTKAFCGSLRLDGSNIEDVFAISDRQKINRIRDNDGGMAMLSWMRWSDVNHQRLSDKTLEWLLANNITESNLQWMKCRFTVEQAMNYITRQRKEQYPDKSPKQVISQYEDYMRMCDKLNKDTSDEMVFRPRELKRRHDEAVLEIERLNAQLKADEYSKKFGEAESVLKTIKDKFEYSGEAYLIRVPEKIVDIVSEGNYLHHCAGATDRYFDRIKSHETYICFLRKVEDPDTPFYTIEVEPGGTIRQHRGMYDEEPELDKVKPFLREWQKEIRKRMSKKDHELAAASKIKREENIEDLKARNNTRVLNGLMEDLMEAI